MVENIAPLHPFFEELGFSSVQEGRECVQLAKALNGISRYNIARPFSKNLMMICLFPNGGGRARLTHEPLSFAITASPLMLHTSWLRTFWVQINQVVGCPAAWGCWFYCGVFCVCVCAVRPVFSRTWGDFHPACCTTWYQVHRYSTVYNQVQLVHLCLKKIFYPLLMVVTGAEN